MSTMNMPGFTAENSICQTTGRYCTATAFDSQNASADVQPASWMCSRILHLSYSASLDGDDLKAAFWEGAYRGYGCPRD